MVVEEILKEGHTNLASAQLDYVRDMANRVGFKVLEPVTELGPDVARICIQISMNDPVFIARLSDLNAGQA